MSWYRTGTVIVTNGSKTVTGVGTLFTTAVNVGDAFALVDANGNPTGAWYEVETVTSNTTMVLKQSYAGSTGSNKQYAVFNLVGNMTTPSFAQRLATFFASFQSLIDKPTTTPTASSIPIADSGGKIADGWIPAKYFNKANILGTVSQSGGVPTGAVIERGSNANGTYVKFADGTMICIVGFVGAVSVTAYGTTGLYHGPVSVTLPATFYQIQGGACGGMDDSRLGIFTYSPYSTSTDGKAYYFTSTSPVISTNARFVFFGRWF